MRDGLLRTSIIVGQAVDDIDRTHLPTPLPPRVWCDFNARGWSGEPDDDCFYVLAPTDLDTIDAIEGLSILLYDWDDDAETQVIACVAQLDRYRDRWRAKPRTGFYTGPRPW